MPNPAAAVPHVPRIRMLHRDHGNQHRQKSVLCELGTWVFFSAAGLLIESAPRAPQSVPRCRKVLASPGTCLVFWAEALAVSCMVLLHSIWVWLLPRP